MTTAKIKKGAVTGAKVKEQTLTGADINFAKLGTVPSAQVANSLSGSRGGARGRSAGGATLRPWG